MADAPASEPQTDEGLPDDGLLAEIEEAALGLARLAGAEITDALQREISVEYKTEARGDSAPTDPVSDVDRAVEQLLRERLRERFPDHGIVGEEVDEHPSPDRGVPVGRRPRGRDDELRQRLPAVRLLHRRTASRAAGRGRGVVLDQPRAAPRRLPRATRWQALLRAAPRHAGTSRQRRQPPAGRRARRRRRTLAGVGQSRHRLRRDRMRLRRRRHLQLGAVLGGATVGCGPPAPPCCARRTARCGCAGAAAGPRWSGSSRRRGYARTANQRCATGGSRCWPGSGRRWSC